MKVTLKLEIDVPEDMGWDNGQDVADTVEEAIDEHTAGGLGVKVTVEDEEP